MLLSFIVLTYFAFHSYLLYLYNFKLLSIHMLLIIFLHIYLKFLKQSVNYHPIREIALLRTPQKKQKHQLKQCPICKRIKPSRYYHCRRCNLCIYRMDHHCQWIGNCIAHFNFKPYFHFLLNLFIHTLISFLYVFVREFQSILVNEDRKSYLLVLIIPIVFILYESLRLLINFCQIVKHNQTLIESYKLVTGKKQSISSNLRQFFGSQNVLLWLIPVYLPFESTDKSSDIYEQSISIEEEKQPEDHTYADEYLYGKDEDDEHQSHHECQHQHKEN